MLVKCLYCDVDNDALATGGFCESCGKKLPSSAMIKPRRTLGGDTPDEPGELVPVPKKSRAVSEGLFAASILWVFAGGAFLVLASPVYGLLVLRGASAADCAFPFPANPAARASTASNTIFFILDLIVACRLAIPTPEVEAESPEEARS